MRGIPRTVAGAARAFTRVPVLIPLRGTCRARGKVPERARRVNWRGSGSWNPVRRPLSARRLRITPAVREGRSQTAASCPVLLVEDGARIEAGNVPEAKYGDRARLGTQPQLFSRAVARQFPGPGARSARAFRAGGLQEHRAVRIPDELRVPQAHASAGSAGCASFAQIRVDLVVEVVGRLAAHCCARGERSAERRGESMGKSDPVLV